ncbi:MAG: glycosyltransferase family 39 protein [Bdellovibrionota bacterium]
MTDQPPEQIRVLHIVLLLVALGSRAVLFLSQGGVLWPDSLAYLEWARRIASHGDFAYHPVYRTPGYSTFLALFLLAGSTPSIGKAIVAVQYLLGVGSALLVFAIAQRLTSHRAAFVAALVFAIHPLELYYETVIQSEALFVPTLLLLIYCAIRSLEEPSVVAFGTLGALSAGVTLVRPLAQMLILIMLAFYCFRPAPQLSRRIAAATLLGSYVLFLLPWLVSNQLNYHFFGMTKDIGLNAFHRTFDGDGLAPSGDEFAELRAIAEREKEKGKQAYFTVVSRMRKDDLSYQEIDRAMLKFATSAIREHPLPYLRNSAEYFLSFFLWPYDSVTFSTKTSPAFLTSPQGAWIRSPEFPNQPDKDVPALRSLVEKYYAIFPIRPWLISAFAAVGALVGARRSGAVSLHLFLATVAAYFALLVSVFNKPEDRFFLPILPLLLILAAACFGGSSVRSSKSGDTPG